MERFKNLIRRAIARDAEKMIIYAGKQSCLCVQGVIELDQDQPEFDAALFETVFKTVLPKVERKALKATAEGMVNIPGLGKLCVIGLATDPALILYMPKAINQVRTDLADIESFKSGWPYFRPAGKAGAAPGANGEAAVDFAVESIQSNNLPPVAMVPQIPSRGMQPAAPADMPESGSFTGTSLARISVPMQESQAALETAAADEGSGMVKLGSGISWGDTRVDSPGEPPAPAEDPSAFNQNMDFSFPSTVTMVEEGAGNVVEDELPGGGDTPPIPLPPEVEQQFPDYADQAGIDGGLPPLDADITLFEDQATAAAIVGFRPPVTRQPPHAAMVGEGFAAPAAHFHPHAAVQQVVQPVYMAPPPPEPEKPREIDYGPDDPTLNGKYEKAPIDAILIQMIKSRSSDVHLTLGQRLIYRIDGEITRMESDPLTQEVMRNLLDPIIPPRNRKEFLDTNDTDFAYAIPEIGRFRVNVFRDRNGVGSVIRHIPSKILTMEQLNLPPVCRSFCELSKGLVLVTGPTGSGKSTTLAAMLDYINRTRADHLITVEDPIEFVHPQIKCLVNQREVHRHTQSFSRSLRAALREDPDIVLIGEMRDLETIAIAIETAETGHLVFGTLHTTTAVSTVDRIIDQFPADRQEQIRMMLSSSLKGVVSQTLVKKIGGGRVAAQEILVTDDAVAAMIREGKNHMINNHLTTQKASGNQVLNAALLKHLQSGHITADDAYLKAVDKKGMVASMQRANIKFTPPSEALKSA